MGILFWLKMGPCRGEEERVGERIKILLKTTQKKKKKKTQQKKKKKKKKKTPPKTKNKLILKNCGTISTSRGRTVHPLFLKKGHESRGGGKWGGGGRASLWISGVTSKGYLR